ncbi:MAG TPA: rod-binding protein [Rhizomicrobium sp.]|jgi:flagellar protein FlgJ|nr:rod-binding protein [Rhizomicrobium sp.]
MNTALGVQGAMAMAQAPIQPPHPQANVAAAQKVAKQFESVFVSEFLGSMFQGISTDGPFGGGQGEEMFRSLMLDEYGKEIVARGGFGLSASITKQLLAHQEKQQ